MRADAGVDAPEERDLLGVLDLASADRREGVHDGVPVHAGGRVPNELGLDVLKHLLRLAAFDPQIARAAAGLPCTIGVLRDERLDIADVLGLFGLRTQDSRENVVVEDLGMLVAELLPVVDLAVGEQPPCPHLARTRRELAPVELVRFVAADGLYQEVVVGRGLLVRLGGLEIQAREPYLVVEQRIGLVTAAGLQDDRLHLLEELGDASAVFDVALGLRIGVELADVGEDGRRQRDAALDAPFEDELRREIAAAVLDQPLDHPRDRPVAVRANVPERILEDKRAHTLGLDAGHAVDPHVQHCLKHPAAPGVVRELLEHRLGDLHRLGAALGVLRALQQVTTG